MQAFDYFPEFVDQAGILDNKYKILDTIGEGRYAKVKVALDITTNRKYAIKFLKDTQNISQNMLEKFLNEVKILSQITSKNIIKLCHVSINGIYKKPNGKISKVIYYVMKIAEYGELYQIIEQTSNFPESIARYFFHQLIKGIEQVHNRQIAHRDIKLENILLDQRFNIKICDFGFATQCTDNNNNKKAFESSQAVGSIEYNSPEITNYSLNQNSHTHYFADELDLFASGNVLFQMVMRTPPFQTSNYNDPYFQRLCRSDKQAFWKIYAGIYEPTQEFKDLVEKMLAKDPEHRLSIEEIKQHPWYSGELPTREELKREMRERTNVILTQTKEKLELKRQKKIQKSKRPKTPPDYQEEVEETPETTELKNIFLQQIQDINENIETMVARKKNQKQQILAEKYMKNSEDKPLHKLSYDQASQIYSPSYEFRNNGHIDSYEKAQPYCSHFQPAEQFSKQMESHSDSHNDYSSYSQKQNDWMFSKHYHIKKKSSEEFDNVEFHLGLQKQIDFLQSSPVQEKQQTSPQFSEIKSRKCRNNEPKKRTKRYHHQKQIQSQKQLSQHSSASNDGSGAFSQFGDDSNSQECKQEVTKENNPIIATTHQQKVESIQQAQLQDKKESVNQINSLDELSARSQYSGSCSDANRDDSENFDTEYERDIRIRRYGNNRDNDDNNQPL